MEEKNGFAIRERRCITIYKGVTNPTIVYKHETKDIADDIQSMKYSNSGKYLAFCDSINTYLIDTETGEELLSYPKTRAKVIVFSPNDTYFVTWEEGGVYVRRRNSDGTRKSSEPNVNYFSVNERRHLTRMTIKRKTEIPHWTRDEKYMLQIVNFEVQAFEDSNIDEYAFKVVIPGVYRFAVCPHESEHLFTAIIQLEDGSLKAELRRINKDMTLVSAFELGKCDKLDLKWNSTGTTMLALVSLDNYNSRYFTYPFIHALSFTGENCCMSLNKEGPILDLKWSPNGSHFAVCYGDQPSKITVYDNFLNVVWDHRQRRRNRIHFNAQGNLFIACGFAPLRGEKIHVWNFEEQKEINYISAENATHLEFSSDGKYFYTAALAHIIRIDNFYRIWKYTGEMVFEYAPKGKYELQEIQWKPIPEAVNHRFDTPPLTKEEKALTGLPQKGEYIPVKLKVYPQNEVNFRRNLPSVVHEMFEKDEAERVEKELQNYFNGFQQQNYFNGQQQKIKFSNKSNFNQHCTFH
jgi:translation initiation factor 2A